MGKGTGSEAYFRVLFEQYHHRLYAYALGKVNDAFLAEEIVQNTFIRYWQKKGTEGPQEDPAFFLFFIAKGLIIDQFRRKATDVPFDEAIPAHTAIHNDLSEKYDRQHEAAVIQQLVTHLPERQQQIFRMKFYEDMPAEEIASSLNITPKTVRNLLTKATRYIRHKKRFSL